MYAKGKKKVKLKVGQYLVDRERAATHQAPTTDPSTTPPSQQYNSSTIAVEQHVPTNRQRQNRVAIRQCSGTPVVLWYAKSWVGFALFSRFSTFRGRARAFSGKGFSCPPLAELGLVSGWVAADTEGLCVGQAWHGRAVAQGRVASSRTEGCKCTGFRVPVIPPLAPQRSKVISLTVVVVLVVVFYGIQLLLVLLLPVLLLLLLILLLLLLVSLLLLLLGLPVLLLLLVVLLLPLLLLILGQLVQLVPAVLLLLIVNISSTTNTTSTTNATSTTSPLQLRLLQEH